MNRYAFIDATLEHARAVEEGASTRCLTASDVAQLLDEIEAAEQSGEVVERARVYACAGAFVARCYKGTARITQCDVGMWGIPRLKRVDARRREAYGPWVTINGRRVA